MNIKCKKLTETAIIPTRATSGSAGYDMYSDETASKLGSVEKVEITEDELIKK